MSNQIRWTMSLRKRDEALIEHFTDYGDGDRSAECRRLMYLGLQLLAMQENGEAPVPSTAPGKVRNTKDRPKKSSDSSSSKPKSQAQIKREEEAELKRRKAELDKKLDML